MNRLLIFVHNLYEDLELWYPKIRAEEAQIQTTVAGPEKNTVYLGKHGYPCKSDAKIADIKIKDFNGLLIPGGFAPDKLRRDERVLTLVQQFFSENKLIAFICHAGWVLISAKILSNKQVTGTIAIKDDLVNAGAIWKDEPVVIDQNLISSRTPKDLPQFGGSIINWFNAR